VGRACGGSAQIRRTGRQRLRRCRPDASPRPRRVEAEPVGKHFFGVLAEQWRRFDFARKAVEAHRPGRHRHFAFAVRHRLEFAALPKAGFVINSCVSRTAPEEAASLDYVLLAVPRNNIGVALRGLPEWNGRVLIDTPPTFIETSPKLVLADLGGIGASEIVLVSREERAPSRRSIPSSWPASTRGRSRAKASA
jgi:hypothetical protein